MMNQSPGPITRVPGSGYVLVFRHWWPRKHTCLIWAVQNPSVHRDNSEFLLPLETVSETCLVLMWTPSASLLYFTLCRWFTTFIPTSLQEENLLRDVPASFLLLATLSSGFPSGAQCTTELEGLPRCTKTSMTFPWMIIEGLKWEHCRISFKIERERSMGLKC